MRGIKAAIAVVLAGGLGFGAAPGRAQIAATPSAAPAASTAYSPHHHRRHRSASAAAPAPGQISASPPPFAQAPPPGVRLGRGAAIPPQELEALVDGVVRQSMDQDHIAGVAVSVVQNGQVILKKGYGFASLSPRRIVDPDRTLFRLGSISKTFTWIAAMKEVERGRMSLTTPINQYLPEKLQIRDQGYSQNITLHALMTHTPGFEDKTLGRLFEANPDRVRPLEDYLRQERPRRVRPPGAIPDYSNFGAAVAGEAVSQVVGRSYQSLIEAEILLPLGLAQTTFREPYPIRHDLPEPMKPAMARDVSDGFRWSGGAYRARPFEYITQIAPAGAASSTARDMARYMSLILAGGTLDGAVIYGPQTAQGFRTVTQRAAPGVNGWANGFSQYALPGGYAGYGHRGDTLSFHANMVTVPDLGLGIFIAANTETAQRLTEHLPEAIVEHFYAAPQFLPLPGSPSLAERRDDFAGRYWSERRAYSGLEKFVSLFYAVADVDVTRDGRLTVRSLDGASSWAPTGVEGQFHATQGVQTSAFEMKKGKAVRWFAPWGGESFKRTNLLSEASTIIVLGLASLVAGVAALVGLFTRERRDFRQTSIQSRAGTLQIATAVLWMLTCGGFGLWVAGTEDIARLFDGWPGPWLMIASACALVASVLSVIVAALLPAIWKGGRRLDSWSTARKARFTATALIFLAFAVVLAVNGALQAWNS